VKISEMVQGFYLVISTTGLNRPNTGGAGGGGDDEDNDEMHTYCGVAPRGRSIERPLLINGYASSRGFIGNDCKSMQRPTSEYWKHVGG
jgi:hypothetical protein